MTDDDLARAYSTGVSSAAASATSAEPEAQLTVPVANLLQGLAAAHGIGAMSLVREAQLDGVRPDYAVLIDGRACGWVELKAPGHPLDGPSWRGREKSQWALLSELDALIVCDGVNALLYRSGQVEGEAAPLPYDGPGGWDSTALVDLLRVMATCRPATITRTSQLATKLAPLARMLHGRIAAGLDPATPSAPIARAKVSWARHVHEHVDDAGFADDLAQVIAYSLAIAALRGGADANGDHYISLAEARASLVERNAVLAAALGPVLGIPGLLDVLAAEVGAIERLVSAVDPVRVATSTDPRGEPWLWFYEDFLDTYDPERRKAAGVYYTPTAVVDLQVRLVESILREKIGRKLGFGDGAVTTLDPATGSGTYPLAVIDRASTTALEVRGPAGPKQVAAALASNLVAFELLPGPYAVAHLRIGQRLAEMAGHLMPPGHVQVYLTDTLDDPGNAPPMLGLWGDESVLAAERERAGQVKSTRPITVVLGNPPYNRGDSATGGGWVVHPPSGRAIFDDITEPPKRAGVIFSVQRSLYDDYLYFWRWAIYKAFEQRSEGPAVVSFITASTWLDGPGFIGLRQLVREVADEVWVVDLGGEGRGANVDDNVFAIRSPVAVVTLYRRGTPRRSPATAYYRRIEGTRAAKLSALNAVQPPGEDDAAWQRLPQGQGGDRLVPVTGASSWQDMPALADVFPWQQPGCIYARAWPIAPTPQVLHQRWEALLARSGPAREEAFVTAKTGRSIYTRVEGLLPLGDLRPGAPARPVVAYGYRSFERQHTFVDPRLAKTESPSLWASLSHRQVFLTSMMTNPMGAGPALTVATAVPDFHHFRGSYGGKDVMPLYRDAAATRPNLPAGLLDLLASRYDQPVTPEDLAAYAAALLAHPGYQQRFAVELQTPGPRLPLTAEPGLFARACEIGRRLLWAQTYTERYRDPAAGRSADLPAVPHLGWALPVAGIPADPREIGYDAVHHELQVGTGRVSGVRPEVWEFSVSGFEVLPKWLGSRTAKGIGRSATRPAPLDLIRPTTWADEWNDELLDLIRMLSATIDLQGDQADLLEEILTGPLISTADLPTPSAAERGVPAT